MARTKRQNDSFLASVWILVFCELEDYWIHGRGESKTVRDACKAIIKRRKGFGEKIHFDQSIKVSGEGAIFDISDPETLRDWFYEAEKNRHDHENHEFLSGRTSPFSKRYETINLIREEKENSDKEQKRLSMLSAPKKPRGRPAKQSGAKATKKLEIKSLDWNK